MQPTQPTAAFERARAALEDACRAEFPDWDAMLQLTPYEQAYQRSQMAERLLTASGDAPPAPQPLLVPVVCGGASGAQYRVVMRRAAAALQLCGLALRSGPSEHQNHAQAAERAALQLNHMLRAGMLPYQEWDGTVLHVGGLEGGKRASIPPTCPVAAGARVAILFRDGTELETDAPEQMRWAWSRPYVSSADIVGYMVLAKAPLQVELQEGAFHFPAMPAPLLAPQQ